MMEGFQNLMLIKPDICGENCGRVGQPPGPLRKPPPGAFSQAHPYPGDGHGYPAQQPPPISTDPAFARVFQLLMEATQQGDISSMRRMLLDCSKGSAIQNVARPTGGKLWSGDTDDAGWSALMEASEHGQNSAMSLLLQKGGPTLDINAGDNNGDTALLIGSYHGHAKVCACLVDTAS